MEATSIRTRGALHPELIRLGLLRYRDARIEQGKQSLFDLPWYEKHGFGKNPSQDFRVLSKAVGVWEHRRLVFHSFRATLAQQLEEAGFDAQLVDRVLGHAVKTTRVRHYSRNQQGATVPLLRVHEALLKIPVEAQVPQWEFVRVQPRQRLSKLVKALGFDASSSRVRHQVLQVMDSYRAAARIATTAGSSGGRAWAS